MSRLFFALWPDDAVRERLAAVQARFPARLGRPVPAANLHATLVFLGEVADQARERLVVDVDAIRAPAFELNVARSGWWRGPRVAWLAPEETPPVLVGLVQDLRAAASGCGVAVEDRPYRAHLTIARKVNRAPRRLRFDPICWQINEFCLVQSTADTGRSEYAVVRRWPLTPA